MRASPRVILILKQASSAARLHTARLHFGPEVPRDMVTGVQEENRYRPHMVTENREEIPSCSSGIS